jgi:hypothetical protein
MRGALLLLLLGSVACAHAAAGNAPTDGHAMPVDARAVVRSIVLCKTTESELIARLGEPTRNGLLGRARIMSWIIQWDHPTRYLGVLLDDRGTVVDLYWDLPTEIPWSPADRCRGRE